MEFWDDDWCALLTDKGALKNFGVGIPILASGSIPLPTLEVKESQSYHHFTHQSPTFMWCKGLSPGSQINQDTISETHEPMSGDGGEECPNCKSSSVARCPPLQLHSSHNSSQGLAEKECEDQYLDSFQMRQVTLQNNIVAEQGHEKSVTPNDSEEDEQAVEIMVQAEGDLVSENLVDHDGHQAVENMMDSVQHDDVEHESASVIGQLTRASDLSQCEDASSAEAGLLCFKPGQLPLEAIQKAQALGMHTTQEAQVIADEYGKTLGSIMAAAGLTTKATHAESVWNMHQAWYAHTNPKASAEETKDYCRHHTKHYEDHKDEDEHPQLWAEIQKYWSECVSGSKDISSKAMAQTWCNVEGIHVFRCVIYSGSDEAACQSQGIFAGSSLLMQLVSERQTNITQLLEYLSTIIKYKILNSAALVPLPDFNVLSQPHYDHALGLKPQEYSAATEENGIKQGQRNVSWKLLLDLLYVHQCTITDWPAGVPAVGPDFNVKCLNADELHALTVPFLKESMGADYHAEAPLDDEDQAEYLVPLLNSSFYLKKWTDDQIELFHHSDARMCDILLVVNTLNWHLCVLSDSDAFVKALPKGDKFKERSAPSSFPDQPV
ncbi:hypothetical protein F5J12DRAFT_786008 [Pisolithus orientalis]|uniref:uncharacterized protein n=1 Tax=Pisolithus orientalis TaxID=936130 RepID=UPI0022247247|nr:uncharacterized protein F5J12DRAFT_786008 [Pisolithus orientalis]KAI5993127.1 hypothetical protein F5J12DRAFT_786008 [Pisolithus orientalis]